MSNPNHDDNQSESPQVRATNAVLDKLIRMGGVHVENSSLTPGEMATYEAKARANQAALMKLFEGRSLEYWRARRVAAREKRQAREAARMTP
jgi:hypothetical protein